MIWTRGEIIPAEALLVSVLDRTFEHGLGLFETFRTWSGHATLLSRHLHRLRRSADALGLPLEPDDLPDAAAVLRLGEASGVSGANDIRLRITLSGGLANRDGLGTTLWMAAGPLPGPMAGRGARIDRLINVAPDDPLVRHKTLNYWRRRIEQEGAGRRGAADVLCVTPDGLICEGTRSNLFLVCDGRLITPGTDGPLLDGVMRGVVIERARSAGLAVVEGPVNLGAIASANEAFLTNSVRGMVPVAWLLHAAYSSPGPVTRLLWDEVLSWLESGGTRP